MTKTQSTSPAVARKTSLRTPGAVSNGSATSVATRASPPARKSSTPTKGDLLVTLLRRADGVSAAQMAEATGWQIHSVRGFIAGTVKKKLGLSVIAEKIDGTTVYRIADEATA